MRRSSSSRTVKAAASARPARSPEKGSCPEAKAFCRSCRNRRRNRRESTRTGRKKPGRQAIQCVPSSERPPPGTTQWICGWCCRVWPQGWRTAVMPTWAPRWRGSAAGGGRGAGGGGGGSECLGGSAKQDRVDDGLVLEGDRTCRRRQGEDDVEIRHRQQFGLPLSEPLDPRRALALLTVAGAG